LAIDTEVSNVISSSHIFNLTNHFKGL